MVPNRFSRMLWSLRVAFDELHDHVSSWLAARRSPRVVVPGAGLCEIFAESLRTNGFEEHAAAVEKPGASEAWEDHAHAFADALAESGDKGDIRVGAELLADVLSHFSPAMTVRAVAMVMLDIANLHTASGDVARATRALKAARSLDKRTVDHRVAAERRLMVYRLCESVGDEPSYVVN